MDGMLTERPAFEREYFYNEFQSILCMVPLVNATDLNIVFIDMFARIDLFPPGKPIGRNEYAYEWMNMVTPPAFSHPEKT